MRGIVLEPRSGYSSVIESTDPGRSKTSQLHGAGLRLGPGASPFLSLANHGDQASMLRDVVNRVLGDAKFYDPSGIWASGRWPILFGLPKEDWSHACTPE